MRRETQNVLLVLVGGVLIKIVLDGSYLRYVAPWSAPALLAGGLAIVVLALAAIARDLHTGGHPDEPPAAPPDEGGDQAHAHGHGAGRSAWLMMLPVLAILLVAPPALGSGALVDGRTRAVADGPAASEPLPPGPAPALAVVDFVSRAAGDPRGPLTGRDVTLTGFLAPGSAPGRPDLARFVISCCAADASAVRVHLAAPPGLLPQPAPGAPDRWVEVRGRLVAGTGTAADGHVPTLTVTDSLPVPPPEQVYEY
jgi:uncharacterized repeat protein (TIGR03943 family)